jgi:hypothetical protein
MCPSLATSLSQRLQKSSSPPFNSLTRGVRGVEGVSGTRSGARKTEKAEFDRLEWADPGLRPTVNVVAETHDKETRSAGNGEWARPDGADSSAAQSLTDVGHLRSCVSDLAHSSIEGSKIESGVDGSLQALPRYSDGPHQLEFAPELTCPIGDAGTPSMKTDGRKTHTLLTCIDGKGTQNSSLPSCVLHSSKPSLSLQLSSPPQQISPPSSVHDIGKRETASVTNRDVTRSRSQSLPEQSANPWLPAEAQSVFSCARHFAEAPLRDSRDIELLLDAELEGLEAVAEAADAVKRSGGDYTVSGMAGQLCSWVDGPKMGRAMEL